MIAGILGKINGLCARAEMAPEMGRPYLRLGAGVGAASDGDRLPAISPDFEENRGQSMGFTNPTRG